MPKQKIRVQDVYNVYHINPDGDIRFRGCMNTVGIDKTLTVEEIRCGHGWTISSLLYSENGMTLTYMPAYWDEYFLADVFGTEFEESVSTSVPVTERVVFALATSDATATIEGTPVDSEVWVQDSKGVMYPATFSTGTVTVTGGASLAGQSGTVTYKSSVTGDTLDLDAVEFPKVHGIILHTYAYDVDTNEILVDFYWEFPRVVGEGNFSSSITGGTNNMIEITERVLPEDTKFGKYISVDRA